MFQERETTVFCPDFLKRKAAREPIPLSAHESTWSGPWTVGPAGERFAVRRTGDPTPVAVTSYRDTALLLAATLPAVGRGPLYWLTPERATGRRMFDLVTILGEQGPAVVGEFERHYEEILTPLSIAEYLVRSPSSLAYLLEAAPVETLVQAGIPMAIE